MVISLRLFTSPRFAKFCFNLRPKHFSWGYKMASFETLLLFSFLQVGGEAHEMFNVLLLLPPSPPPRTPRSTRITNRQPICRPPAPMVLLNVLSQNWRAEESTSQSIIIADMDCSNVDLPVGRLSAWRLLERAKAKAKKSAEDTIIGQVARPIAHTTQKHSPLNTTVYVKRNLLY